MQHIDTKEVYFVYPLKTNIAMVGRRSFPFEMVHFLCRFLVSFGLQTKPHGTTLPGTVAQLEVESLGACVDGLVIGSVTKTRCF